jgi:hypothetical protein
MRFLVKAWQWMAAGAMALFVARPAVAAGMDAAKDPALPTGGKRGDYESVRLMARKLGGQLGWRPKTIQWFERFAQVQAWSESRANSAAANRTKSEATAAARAYARNAPKMPDLVAGTKPEDWTWGSGGWFGFLPANGVFRFKDQGAAVGEISPMDVFDPWRSTVMLLVYASRLTNWSNFRDLETKDQNAYALKRGFASPTLMDDVTGNARADISHKHVDQAVRALGIPASWASEPVPSEMKNERGRSDWLTVLRKGEGRA